MPHTDSIFGHPSHGRFVCHQPQAGVTHDLMGDQSGAPVIPVILRNENSASRIQVITPPIRHEMPSERACFAALSPLVWSARMVVAAAMPVGNGSCSTLIIWRLAGTARKTPIHAMQMSHGISHRQRWPKLAGSDSGWSIMSAGMAFTIPALVIAAAADAPDCMALFSRMLKGGKSRGSALWSAAKMV